MSRPEELNQPAVRSDGYEPPPPPVVLACNEYRVGRVARPELPGAGFHLAVANPATATGWDHYECLGKRSLWFATTAAHQPIPNALPGDVVVGLRKLPPPRKPWPIPAGGGTRALLQLDGCDIAYLLPGGLPHPGDLIVLDSQVDRREFRVVGVRVWYELAGMHTTGDMVYSRVASAVLLAEHELQ